MVSALSVSGLGCSSLLLDPRRPETAFGSTSHLFSKLIAYVRQDKTMGKPCFAKNNVGFVCSACVGASRKAWGSILIESLVF